MQKRLLEFAEILDNSQTNSVYFKLGIRLYGIESIFPGQFINLKIPPCDFPNTEPVFDFSEFVDLSIKKPLLLRPFSVGRILSKNLDSLDVELIIKEVGIGSYILHQLTKGQKLKFLGPLGSRFTIKENTENAILIGGGTGVAPLMALSDILSKNNIRTFLFLGGLNKDNLPVPVKKGNNSIYKIIQNSNAIISEMESEFCSTAVSTDDGSIGFHGFVTDLFEKFIETQKLDNKKIQVFSCGPMKMMEKIQCIVQKSEYDHQVSLERHMACGLGVCLSCVNEKKNIDKKEYLRVCLEGPVFDANEVKFHD
jgi:dihydroorotate dehydrogenase electron transfer subunit